ncbi:MAG: DNA primase, partial [Muribaculaceae bacterium]|nr:DNA primase [Muribaculaceae bacterium]
MIDRATVQKIKDTARIQDVVKDYVSLSGRGPNYMALCPFHNERTPSFHVNTVRNFCYCFSCHTGGGPIDFLMKKEGITYPEALKKLADRYGIKVEEKELTDEEREKQSAREAMIVANEWAMKYFENSLFETEEGQNVGLSYIYDKRQLTYEAVKA